MIEREHRPVGGTGLAIAGRCDECGVNTGWPRRLALVLAGDLRGMRGRVCLACIAKRPA